MDLQVAPSPFSVPRFAPPARRLTSATPPFLFVVLRLLAVECLVFERECWGGCEGVP